VICLISDARVRKLLYFVFVGGVGFVVDGGVLTLLSQFFEFDIYLSRLWSFSTATLITWRLNRTLTFQHDADPSMQKRVEYGRYLLVQTSGALANLAVFSLIIEIHQPMKAIPIVPLFIGAIFGLIINFTGSRYWVFRKRNDKEKNV